MNFCILSPIAGLERYATLSKTHLLLPQLDKIPGYREFYLKRREENDFLILDNGAYEGQTDWENLKHCIDIYNPQVCALPDYLLQPWEKTYHSAIQFLDCFYDKYPQTAWMYIPQSTPSNIVGFCNGLFRALDDPRISWIGLPRALAYSISNDEFMRHNVAVWLKRYKPGIKIHALGMAKGSVKELNSLRGIVNSIDSNAPVWRGWCGYSLIPNEWNEFPINYEAALRSDHDAFILDNLDAVGVYTIPRRNLWPNQ
jgi:hypothetical protein